MTPGKTLPGAARLNQKGGLVDMYSIAESEDQWNEAPGRANAAAEKRELAALAGLLDAAGARLADDPDEALLLLDGLLPRMIACWLARRGFRWVGRPALLDALAEHDERLAYHARLALRAPNAAARLAACQRLYQACFGAEVAALPGR